MPSGLPGTVAGWTSTVNNFGNHCNVTYINGPTTQPTSVDLSRGDYVHGVFGGVTKVINCAGIDIQGLSNAAPDYLWSIEMLINGEHDLWIDTGDAMNKYVFVDWWVDHHHERKYGLYKKHWFGTSGPGITSGLNNYHTGNSHFNMSTNVFDVVNPWPVPHFKQHEHHSYRTHKWRFV